MGIPLASVFVEVRPDLTRFGPEMKRGLTSSSMSSATSSAGKASGHHFRSSFGSALKGIAAPLTAALAGVEIVRFFKSSITEAQEAAKVSALTAQVIKTTGGVAGVTTKQVADLANAISLKTGIDDEAIQSGENLLLTFKNIHNETGKGNDIFDRATRSVTDMSVALGQDMKSGSIQLGKALNDPIKGITALTRVGVTFTEQQKNQIAAMVESGNTLGAQKIILKELESEFGGAATAAATPLDKLNVAWKNLEEQVGTAVMPLVNQFATLLTTTVIPALSEAGSHVGDLDFSDVKTSLSGIDFSKLADSLIDLGGGLKDSSQSLPSFNDVLNVTATGLKFAADHTDLVVKALPFLAAGFLAVKAAQLAANAAATIAVPVRIAEIVANRALTKSNVQLMLAIRAQSGALGQATVGEVANTTAKSGGIFASIRSRVATLAKTVAERAAAAASKAMAAATWLVNLALRANPIGIVVTALVALGAGLVLAYKKSDTFREIVNRAWASIRAGVSFAWNRVIQPVLKAFWGFLVNVLGPALKFLWDRVAKPVFEGIGRIISFWWNNVVKPVFSALKTFFTSVLFPVFRFLWNNVVKPVFAGIKGTISNVWTNGIKPVFQAIGSFIKDKVAPVFRDGVRRIGDLWAGLKHLAGKPITFIIDKVINEGLIDGFNFLARKVGAGEIDKLDVPHFARGGVLAGRSVGRDNMLIAAAGGEAVMRQEWTDVVGKDRIDAWNKAAREGGAAGVRRALGTVPQDRRFAAGGVVWPVPGRDTSTYPGHDGVDINRGSGSDDYGDQIVAALGGIVSYVGSGRGYGDAIFIRNTAGSENIYGHTSSQNVLAGQRIATGYPIGRVGSTGNSSAPHLHFGVNPGMTFASAMNFLTGALDVGVSAFGGNATTNPSTLQRFSAAVTDKLTNPLSYLKDKISGALDSSLLDNPFGKILKSVPGKLMSAMGDKIKGLASSALGTVGTTLTNVAAAGGSSVALLQGQAATLMQQLYGWKGSAYTSPLNSLWQKESGWNPLAENASSGAYGIPQSLPGDKMAAAGADWKTNPTTQMLWGLGYIKDRYGSPGAAWAHSQSTGWYDDGGIARGRQFMPKLTALPERVLSPRQTRAFERLVDIQDQSRNSGRQRITLDVGRGVSFTGYIENVAGDVFAGETTRREYRAAIRRRG